MDKFATHDAVRINRPNKRGHGHIGRLVGVGQTPQFAWVAFLKSEAARAEPPPVQQLHRQDLYPRQLFPLSQLEKCTAPPQP